MTGLLSLRDLTGWYTPDRPVLDRLSLELESHEVVGLMGLNGAGKTTLLKILSGLLGSFRAGETAWHGRPVSFRDEAFKRSRFTVLAEGCPFRYFTFREYLAYASACYQRPLPEVGELVEGFGFGRYTDYLLKDLSTGNLKKAYLITAFALGPELLLLDEPVNGLDFQSTEYLYRRMGEYKARGTILFSSHILESLCLTADRVLVLDRGRICRSFTGPELDAGAIREVLNRESQS
ncbi:MAG: ABC transporter ATP-binding protein [Eubacteriales bacterium]|nr:ABC transporter ATP-binding protein [Eubacteriales bacterium]